MFSSRPLLRPRVLLVQCRSYSSNFTIIKEGDPTSQALWNSAKPFKKIPGPKTWPFLGTLPSIIKTRYESPSEDYMVTWHRRYGPLINTTLLNGKGVSCHDAKLLKLVIQNEVSRNNSRNKFLEEKFSYLNRQINTPTFMFFSNGDEWKTLRSAMNKPSTPRRVAMFSSQLYDTANDLGNYWITKKNENGVIDDIRDDLQKWALKGVTWFTFNKELSVFGESDEVSEKFTKAAIEFLDSSLAMIFALPIYKLFPTPAYKRYANAVHNIHSIGERIMQSRFEEIQSLIKKVHDLDSDRISLMEHLLIEGKLPKESALTQVCDLISAGVDTTSATASFLLHHIAKDTKLQQSLFDEISFVCGLNRMPDFNELQKLSLVRNCVKETLRLYPPSKFLLRMTEHDMVINGYQVPKKSTIFFNLLIMGIDPKLYTNPLSFDPYRWNNKELDDTLISYLPFGAGVRMCYGRRLAELELHLLLVTMIQRFALSTDQSSVCMDQRFVLKPGEAVKLKIQKR